MLNYEICKKLKDAEFPHISFNEIEIGGQKIMTHERYPSLEELIEACGDKLALLGQKDGVWCAYDTWDLPNAVSNTITRSNSPVEAVASLWLELHKK